MILVWYYYATNMDMDMDMDMDMGMGMGMGMVTGMDKGMDLHGIATQTQDKETQQKQYPNRVGPEPDMP